MRARSVGQGSGSTPTLMGTGRGQDKFVVITDGQDLMHQDLFWRNGIPKDWQGMGGDRPRRMACEYPVTFGDPDAEASLSEQSVAVRGYATFNVNNLLDYDFPDGLPAVLLNALAALRGGDTAATPHGAERIAVAGPALEQSPAEVGRRLGGAHAGRRMGEVLF